MALEAQNNPFPSVLMVEAADETDPTPDALPAAGQRRLIVGPDHLLYLLDDAGVATAVGGGGFTDPMTTRGDMIVRNASNVTARLAKGSADTYLGSDGTDLAFSAVTDAKLSTSDITTNNASTSKHGFLKKLSNVSTEYMDGTGAWSTPAGGGGGGALVLLEQHTASSSATLDFTAFISSTYDDYEFRGVGLAPATNGVDFCMKVGTGGGPTYAGGTDYFSSVTGQGSSSTGYAYGVAAGAQSVLARVVSNGAGYGHFSFTAHLRGPQDTSLMKAFDGTGTYHNGTQSQSALFNSLWGVTTTLTAVRFLFSSGNIASGTIRVYGVAK